MMRRISLSLLAATAMGVIACQGASAADLRMPTKAPIAPLPPPVQDWSGVYVGIEGGYGWAHEDATGTFPWNADPIALANNATCGPNACVNAPFEAALAFIGLAIDPGLPSTNIGSHSLSGWLGGGFFGVQKQWGSWVLGIEADADGADIKGSTTFSSSTSRSFGINGGPNTISGDGPITATNAVALTSKIDMLGSVRGKVGWAWSPNWMIYGTGGLGFAHKESSLTNTNSFTFCDEFFSPTTGQCTFGGTTVGDTVASAVSTSANSGTTMFGWTAGAGIDWKWQIDQGSAWVLGVEYLHYGFGSHTQTFSTTATGGIPTFFGVGGNTFSMTTKDDVDVVKGRISYLFSIH